MNQFQMKCTRALQSRPDRAWASALLYGAAHFGVDFGCAYVAFSGTAWDAKAFLLYNF